MDPTTNHMVTLSQGFSNLALTFGVGKFFVIGGFSVCYGVFSSILGFYPLDARSNSHPSTKNQKCLQAFFPEGKNCSQLRIIASTIYAHENLTTKGKDSQFVTEHVPWTELLITVAGVYTVFNKSSLWGALFDFPIVERCKAKQIMSKMTGGL